MDNGYHQAISQQSRIKHSIRRPEARGVEGSAYWEGVDSGDFVMREA